MTTSMQHRQQSITWIDTLLEYAAYGDKCSLQEFVCAMFPSKATVSKLNHTRWNILIWELFHSIMNSFEDTFSQINLLIDLQYANAVERGCFMEI